MGGPGAVRHDVLPGGASGHPLRTTPDGQEFHAATVRGGAELDLQLWPFDYRRTAAYYGVEDPLVALHLYATLGGTPGYRDLVGAASPQSADELDDLVLQTVANPSHALFSEAEYLLREDPRIVERSLYHSILGAVARGARTPTAIAARIGRPVTALGHSLGVLQTAGFLRRREDLLRRRRPILEIVDPIVRFADLIIDPYRPVYEDRRGRQALAQAEATLRTQTYGPAFEQVAREWVARHASPDTLGGVAGMVGTTVVNDSRGRSQYEVDVVALPVDQGVHDPHARILALGEAEDSDAPRPLSDLARLETIRDLMVRRGYRAEEAKLLVFGRSGFDAALSEEASGRADVELVSLERLRAGQ